MISAAVAALQIGKHLVLTGPNPDQTDALAELITDEALDSGVSIGTFITTGVTSALLGPRDLLSESFRSDIWVVLRSADDLSLRRFIDDLAADEISTNWRFLAVPSASARSFLAALSPAARRVFALISVN